jgi:septum formation protein
MGAMPRRLILASASPARLGLLRSAGLDPEVVVSGVAEDDVVAPDTRALVAELARRKAEAVAADGRAAGALVLGCDSLLDFDGRAQGKPGAPDVAAQWWRERRRRSATLLTGHCLIDTAACRHTAAVVGTVVHFGDPSDEEIEAYVRTGEPLAVAGGFTLEGRAGAFVDGIDGDPNNVVGLSLAVLRRLLATLGCGITELWT